MSITKIISIIFMCVGECFILIALPTVQGLEITIALAFIVLSNNFWNHKS